MIRRPPEYLNGGKTWVMARPAVMRPSAVRIHARNVRSFAYEKRRRCRSCAVRRCCANSIRRSSTHGRGDFYEFADASRHLTVCAQFAPRFGMRVVVAKRDAEARVALPVAYRDPNAAHSVTRISSPRTCSVHGKPTSENGSRAAKLLVTMLTTSPRYSPAVIAHSKAIPCSRVSADTMNAS